MNGIPGHSLGDPSVNRLFQMFLEFFAQMMSQRVRSADTATCLIEIAIAVVHFEFSMSCVIAVVSCDQDCSI